MTDPKATILAPPTGSRAPRVRGPGFLAAPAPSLFTEVRGMSLLGGSASCSCWTGGEPYSPNDGEGSFSELRIRHPACPRFRRPRIPPTTPMAQDRLRAHLATPSDRCAVALKALAGDSRAVAPSKSGRGLRYLAASGHGSPVSKVPHEAPVTLSLLMAGAIRFAPCSEIAPAGWSS